MKKRKIISVLLALSLMPTFGALHAGAQTQSKTTVVRLNPSDASPFNNGEFQGFGTSLCWWANRLGYSDTLTQAAAEAFFSEEGLGLDIARYNLGGGDNPEHNHITRSDSKVPGIWETFELSKDGKDVTVTSYDITNDQNQLNIAKAALKQNPDLYFEGFSNSPPYFMTNSGCSSGAVSASNDNLNPNMYDDFGKFIAAGTKLLKENGIEFQSYSPMNEPDTSYWGANSWKQEGCHYSPGESQSKAILETRKALDSAGLTNVLVAGMDETSIDTTVKNYPLLSNEAKTALGRIDTHSYSGSKRAEAKATAAAAGKDLWMSEVDAGGNGSTLASMIISDMNGMQPSAWVMWDIMDFHKDSSFVDPVNNTKTEANNSISYTDNVWGVGMADHDAQELIFTNKYYSFGQFTKYINPGDTIIASSDTTLAAYNKKTGDIKIVANNPSATDLNYVFDLSAFKSIGTKVEEIRTDMAGNEKWASITDEATLSDKLLSAPLKANTVTTFVISGASSSEYLYIDGAESIFSLSEPVQYTAVASDSSEITWSVSDTNIAAIDSKGLLTPKSTGVVTITATSKTLGSFDLQVTVRNIAKLNLLASQVTGSSPWSQAPQNICTNTVDGNLSTYFDGLTNGYVTIDLGASYAIGALGYAPRAGYEDRMSNGSFYGSNDNSSWELIASVPYQPESGVMSYLYDDTFANKTKTYRYIKYTTADNCNVAELEVWLHPDIAARINISNSISIPEKTYGNLYMPTELDGASISWTSSNTAVISGNGVVTRQATDTAVTLTAEVKIGDSTLTKTYNTTVMAAPSNKSDKDMNAYLFVHFTGTEGSASDEQIYFSVSQDGENWELLNDNAPILTSTLGEKGVRDPHIVRSPEGDKFYLIATDLSIYGRRGDSNRWSSCQTAGSQSIMIWESDNLVNWSNQRMVHIAPDNAGCTWAPESVYDEESGSYMVFWASKTAADNYSKQRIYRSYTRDFVNFTEPEIYIENDNYSVIDATIIKSGDMYYRFLKNESSSYIYCETSSSLNGEWKEVSGFSHIQGAEGPTCFKKNGSDTDFVLMTDFFSTSAGYVPYTTSNIAGGAFTKGSAAFPSGVTYRHGAVIPITTEEYNKLIEQYRVVYDPVDTTHRKIADLDFDSESLDNADVITAANGTISYADGYRGKAAVLDGKSYISLDAKDSHGLLRELDEFTVAFWAKSSDSSANGWWFYTAPSADKQTYLSEKYIGILDKNNTVTAERYNSNKASARPASASSSYTGDEWHHITLVNTADKIKLYINGELVSTADTSVNISKLLSSASVAYIGKANWGNSGEYAKGMIDEFEIYNYAFSDEEVKNSTSFTGNEYFGNIMLDTDTAIFNVISDNPVLTFDAYLASYDESGALTGIKHSEIKSGELTLTADSGSKFRAYLWNGMEAVCSSK